MIQKTYTYTYTYIYGISKQAPYFLHFGSVCLDFPSPQVNCIWVLHLNCRTWERLAQCLNDMTIHNIKSNTVPPLPAEGLEVCESRPSLLLRLTELGGRAPPHAGACINRDTREIPTAEVVLKTRYPSRTWWVIIIFPVSYYIGSAV